MTLPAAGSVLRPCQCLSCCWSISVPANQSRNKQSDCSCPACLERDLCLYQTRTEHHQRCAPLKRICSLDGPDRNVIASLVLVVLVSVSAALCFGPAANTDTSSHDCLRVALSCGPVDLQRGQPAHPLVQWLPVVPAAFAGLLMQRLGNEIIVPIALACGSIVALYFGLDMMTPQLTIAGLARCARNCNPDTTNKNC